MEGELPNAYGWLIAGAILLGLEAFGIPGVGFLFAGLAAILVGLAVHLNLIAADDWILQAGVFFGLTTLMAALLWKKIQQWRLNAPTGDQFSNIIGDYATVGKDGLKKGRAGQVSWSGTTMSAQIDPGCALESLEEGAVVIITAVKGNQLFVAPESKAG